MTLPKSLAPRSRRALAALALAFGVAACEDPFQLQASNSTADASFQLWAMSGAPVAYPSGLLVAQTSVVRLDAAGSFDLAFDIDADGRLMVWPVTSVVSPIAGSRAIAFQRSTGVYNALLEAPKNGWTNDTLLLVEVGDVFFTKVTTLYCQYDLRQDIYAKFLVDSIIPAERRIRLSARVNPNCGFRSLELGVPEF